MRQLTARVEGEVATVVSFIERGAHRAQADQTVLGAQLRLQSAQAQAGGLDLAHGQASLQIQFAQQIHRQRQRGGGCGGSAGRRHFLTGREIAVDIDRIDVQFEDGGRAFEGRQGDGAFQSGVVELCVQIGDAGVVAARVQLQGKAGAVQGGGVSGFRRRFAQRRQQLARAEFGDGDAGGDARIVGDVGGSPRPRRGYRERWR